MLVVTQDKIMNLKMGIICLLQVEYSWIHTVFSPSSLNTVSEDFESVFGPSTEVKEIQIKPVQEGNQISVNVPFLYNHCLYD